MERILNQLETLMQQNQELLVALNELRSENADLRRQLTDLRGPRQRQPASAPVAPRRTTSSPSVHTTPAVDDTAMEDSETAVASLVPDPPPGQVTEPPPTHG